MSKQKSWEFGSFAACLLLTAACANNAADTGTDDQSQTPQTASAGKTGSSMPTAGKTGAAAGAKATAGTSSSAGASGGSAGDGATVSAVAVIQPFMMGGATSGAAGGGAAGASSGTAGSASTAGKGGSGAAGKAGSGSSSGGTGGKAAAGAGGTGSGAGLSGVTGTATFSKSKIGIDLTIDISAGCENGKSYPVHIHEGTSCASVATQMGHWGAPQAAAGAAGSGSAAGAGAAGHDANHAAAGSGAAGSSAGAAGAAGSGTMLMYRGEQIPAIKCSGVTGKTSTTRSTPDERLVWNIGTMDETDVVGHVLVVHDVDNSRIGCGKIELK